MTQLAVGFEHEVVFAFFNAIGIKRDDGQFIEINECRLSESHRETLKRWEAKHVIPLGRLDEFLMKHDLMLFELEDWARANLGRDGFIDPLVEPTELAA